jgi:hypothetical protein
MDRSVQQPAEHPQALAAIGHWTGPSSLHHASLATGPTLSTRSAIRGVLPRCW